MAKRMDLAGQRFGNLTVLHPAEDVGSRAAWVCRCACGRETIVPSYRLRSGRTKSCGCPQYGKKLTFVDGTNVELLAAKTMRKNNTSGVTGVDWWSSKRLWRAAICFKGKRYYLGSYSKFEDAVKARKKAEEELHDNFLHEYTGATVAKK